MHSRHRPGTNICVYCGAQKGGRREYLEAARGFGERLAARGIGLVYGGGSTGMMGAIAEACMAAGGHVEGVVPEGLFPGQILETGLTFLHQVDGMHARKSLMADLSDALVALPGGLGTLEEFFEALTWAQLGLHVRPIALLNVSGFYNHLLRFLEHSVGEGFVKSRNLEKLIVREHPDPLIDDILALIGRRGGRRGQGATGSNHRARTTTNVPMVPFTSSTINSRNG